MHSMSCQAFLKKTLNIFNEWKSTEQSRVDFFLMNDLKSIDFPFKISYNEYATIITIIERSFFKLQLYIFYEQDIIKVDYIYLALYESCSQL